MQIQNQTLELVDVSALTPHPDNPRRGDLDAIAASIHENGFYGAVVAQRSTGYVLAGNHRLAAVKRDGGKQIPCFWLDVSDVAALRILSADNRTADLGTYDHTQLAELLTRIQSESDGSLAGTGYTQEAFDAVIAAVGDAVLAAAGGDPVEETEEPQVDRAAELQVKWGTATGQIWNIGKHRLMCGDSTLAADVALLMAGAKADLVFTDPPYNVDYEGYTEEKLTIQSDKMPADKFQEFLLATFTSYRSLLADEGSMYVCHPSSWQREFQAALEVAGFQVRTQIIWAKNTFAWGFARYKFQHEPIFYVHVKGKKDAWYGDKSQSTLWEEKRPAANRLHPTMKPVEPVERALVNSSKAGELVVDLFGGSGTTLIACERLNRRATLMEMDPKYVAVILERCESLGLKPVLSASAS